MKKRAAATEAPGIAHVVTPPPGSPGLVGEFLARLPFPLTDAQRRAIDEIAADLGATHPMHRLLQGDVGAGKTVVALATLLYGVQGGHQGALMVPTEVLAEQHYLSAQSLLGGLEVLDPSRLGGARPIAVALLTNRTSAGERSRIAVRAAGRESRPRRRHPRPVDRRRPVPVARGGRHRRAAPFRRRPAGGTARKGPWRARFRGRSRGARPAPRRARDDRDADPAHRRDDRLRRSRPDRPRRAPRRADSGDDRLAERARRGAGSLGRVRKEVAAGHQAYVICPLVGGGQPEDEEPELIDDARVELEERTGSGRGTAADDAPRSPDRAVRACSLAGELAGLAVGLLHGQLPSKEKEATMAAFRRGELQVLVATTVIEVGVDVANATVMVIEDADRFGIAQLHQLRGRVGRGEHRSWCYLLAEAVTSGADKRLRALEATTDGFELAEVDLELRGEGTVLGIRQKGRSDLRLASLRRDKALVRAARRVAEAIVDEDPTLEDASRCSPTRCTCSSPRRKRSTSSRTDPPAEPAASAGAS